MKQQTVNQNRRRVLLGTAAGAAVVGAWHKPMINAVVLPAHAGMSEEVVVVVMEDPLGIDLDTIFIDLNRDDDRLLGEINRGFNPLDLFIDSAHAGIGVPGSQSDLKVTYLGDGMFDYEHVNRSGREKRSGVVELGAIVEVDLEEGGCSNNTPQQHSVEVLTADADGVTLRITGEPQDNNGNSNGERNGNEQGDVTYFLEPGDATLEIDGCLIHSNGDGNGNNGDANGQAPF